MLAVTSLPMNYLNRAKAIRVSPSVAGALVAISFVLWTCLARPWWATYMESSDEGFNLGKAALVAVGQSPYGRMWNDQPPILTYVLAAAQSVAPGNVAVARGVILASACLMLWSLYRLVYRSAGHVGARRGIYVA